MKRANRLLTWGIIMTVCCVMGCKGPTGPQGPRGPQGEQGPEGVEGPEGTANVVYSDWTGFDSSNWSDAYTYFGQMRRDYPVVESRIDSSILNRGTVMVYVDFAATSEVDPLPLIAPITAATGEQVLNFNLKSDTLNIYMHNLTAPNEDPLTIASSSNLYRYVIIPGGTAASKMKGLDLSDYFAVMKRYGIEP